MIKVLAIVGPTAVGKTELSINIAKAFNGEVISGDSMQVYRGLDIGTAKISDKEKQGVPHFLINIRDIGQRFSVADFVVEAKKKIKEISQRNHLPLIVGGTGFYLQALQDGLNLGGDKYDSTIRNNLLAELKNKGPLSLHQRLASLDLQAANNIPANNSRRVIRALEVFLKTGHKFSEQKQLNQNEPYDFFIIGLNTSRDILYSRINKRVDIMMADGLLKEAKLVYQELSPDKQAAKGIGYREFFPYFDGKIDLNKAVDNVKKDSRHYAKRQLTWFRNKTKPVWYDVILHHEEKKQILADISNWLCDKK